MHKIVSLILELENLNSTATKSSLVILGDTQKVRSLKIPEFCSLLPSCSPLLVFEHHLPSLPPHVSFKKPQWGLYKLDHKSVRFMEMPAL